MWLSLSVLLIVTVILLANKWWLWWWWLLLLLLLLLWFSNAILISATNQSTGSSGVTVQARARAMGAKRLGLFWTWTLFSVMTRVPCTVPDYPDGMGMADPTAPFPVGSNSRWRPVAILENFKRPYLSNALSDSLYVCTQTILCPRSLNL